MVSTESRGELLALQSLLGVRTPAHMFRSHPRPIVELLLDLAKFSYWVQWYPRAAVKSTLLYTVAM